MLLKRSYFGLQVNIKARVSGSAGSATTGCNLRSTGRGAPSSPSVVYAQLKKWLTKINSPLEGVHGDHISVRACLGEGRVLGLLFGLQGWRYRDCGLGFEIEGLQIWFLFGSMASGPGA